jgi:hypothetical protein
VELAPGQAPASSDWEYGPRPGQSADLKTIPESGEPPHECLSARLRSRLGRPQAFWREQAARPDWYRFPQQITAPRTLRALPLVS